MPSLVDAFDESLIQEQDKLDQMGVMQTSNNQALLVTDSNNAQARGKHKGKDPKATNSRPQENHRYFDGDSGSIKEKNKSPYYMKAFHQ